MFALRAAQRPLRGTNGRLRAAQEALRGTNERLRGTNRRLRATGRLPSAPARRHRGVCAFAKALDLEGNIAVIGSENDDDDDLNSGSAYIFDIATGQQLAKLTPSAPTMLGFFGASIDIEGDQVLIGQWFGAFTEESQGRAYLIDIPTASEVAVFEASDGEDYDLFGFALGLSETAAVVGAYAADHGGLVDPGAAYVFDLASCAPDLNGDGEVNTQDFLLFLNAWSSGDPLADWNGDGVVNTQDFLAYLNDWVAGC